MESKEIDKILKEKIIAKKISKKDISQFQMRDKTIEEDIIKKAMSRSRRCIIHIIPINYFDRQLKCFFIIPIMWIIIKNILKKKASNMCNDMQFMLNNGNCISLSLKIAFCNYYLICRVYFILLAYSS